MFDHQLNCTRCRGPWATDRYSDTNGSRCTGFPLRLLSPILLGAHRGAASRFIADTLRTISPNGRSRFKSRRKLAYCCFSLTFSSSPALFHLSCNPRAYAVHLFRPDRPRTGRKPHRGAHAPPVKEPKQEMAEMSSPQVLEIFSPNYGATAQMDGAACLPRCEQGLSVGTGLSSGPAI
jgi:hypothetical protein